jgi:hypothetical protein
VGNPVQATVISVPSQAHPGAYARQTAPGAGKQLPCAEQPSASGKPQRSPGAQSALFAHAPPSGPAAHWQVSQPFESLAMPFGQLGAQPSPAQQTPGEPWIWRLQKSPVGQSILLTHPDEPPSPASTGPPGEVVTAHAPARHTAVPSAHEQAVIMFEGGALGTAARSARYRASSATLMAAFGHTPWQTSVHTLPRKTAMQSPSREQDGL